MIIGIDPGLKGAIAYLNEKGDIVKVEDMPTFNIKVTKTRKAKKGELGKSGKPVKSITVEKNKPVLDCKEFFNKLEDKQTIILEKVIGRPGQSSVATFNFGEVYGQINMACKVKTDELIDVTPTEWQKHFNVTLTKEEKDGKTANQQGPIRKKKIANKVLELYPEAELYTKRGALKDGRADAILIARYLYETMS